MASKHFDFLVLGGGSAGFNAAALAREYVEDVAIVDGSEELGGLCILRGCMPSKTLLYAADVFHLARNGRDLGLNITRPQVDMEALQNRKKRIIGDFARHRRSQLESEHFSLFREKGRLAPDRKVVLESGETLTADRILISTGSRVAVPDVPGLAEVPFITSDEVLNLTHVPESVVVLGGGVVACELAQFLSRIGSSVVMIQRSPWLLSDMEPDMAAVLEEALMAEGIELFTGTKIENIAVSDAGVSVQFRQGNRSVVREGTRLFNALGRRPDTGDLGLEEAGIDTHPDGRIVADGYQRTSQAGIYAAGDCAGPHEIVHIAVLQGETAARHSLGLNPDPVDYDRVLGVVFTDPQIASLGPPVATLRERYGDALRCAEFPFADHGRAVLMNATRGYVRLFADVANRKVVRAECIGRDAGELIHGLSAGIGTHLTVDDLLRAPWYHPTLSEIWTYPLEDIAEMAPADARKPAPSPRPAASSTPAADAPRPSDASPAKADDKPGPASTPGPPPTTAADGPPPSEASPPEADDKPGPASTPGPPSAPAASTGEEDEEISFRRSVWQMFAEDEEPIPEPKPRKKAAKKKTRKSPAKKSAAKKSTRKTTKKAARRKSAAEPTPPRPKPPASPAVREKTRPQSADRESQPERKSPRSDEEELRKSIWGMFDEDEA